jgi:hypothetical protein
LAPAVLRKRQSAPLLQTCQPDSIVFTELRAHVGGPPLARAGGAIMHDHPTCCMPHELVRQLRHCTSAFHSPQDKPQQVRAWLQPALVCAPGQRCWGQVD